MNKLVNREHVFLPCALFLETKGEREREEIERERERERKRARVEYMRFVLVCEGE